MWWLCSSFCRLRNCRTQLLQWSLKRNLSLRPQRRRSLNLPYRAIKLCSGIHKLAACLDKRLDRLDQGAVESKTLTHKRPVPLSSVELCEEESVTNSPIGEEH